jgi:hypothetical protein
MGGCSSPSECYYYYLLMNFHQTLIDGVEHLFWHVDNMVYTRGSKDNFDKWANVTDDVGLSWDNMFSYMLKVC